MSVEETTYVYGSMHFCLPSGLRVDSHDLRSSIVGLDEKIRLTFSVPMLPLLREVVAHLEAAEAKCSSNDLAPAESE